MRGPPRKTALPLLLPWKRSWVNIYLLPCGRSLQVIQIIKVNFPGGEKSADLHFACNLLRLG